MCLAAEHARTVFRPNLYIGTKTSSPQPVSTGLMWFAGDHIYNGVRHVAEMGDKLKKWGWVAHDGHSFGRHELTDPDAAIHMTADFVRQDAGNETEAWTLRIKGRPLRGKGRKRDGERNDLSLVFYVANEGGDLKLEKSPADAPEEPQPSAIITGSTDREGAFDFTVLRSASGSATIPAGVAVFDVSRERDQGDRSSKAQALGLRVPPNELWRAKDHLVPILQRNRANALKGAKSRRVQARKENKRRKEKGMAPLDLPSKNPGTLPLLQLSGQGADSDNQDKHNLIAVQFVVAPTFEVVIRFGQGSRNAPATTAMPGNLTNDIDTRMASFNKKFEELFSLSTGFEYDEKHIAFAKAAFSNLIGSTTFFYGSSLVQPQSSSAGPSLSNAGPLVTGVPSRSFFPRGFLWDEGFHQLLVSAWDPAISRRVIRHWLGRMDDDGWIPREQILGDEALSKVPEKFRVQSPDIANPPAMLLTIERMMDGFESSRSEVLPDGSASGSIQLGSDEETIHFLAEVYPLFRRHYRWLRKTQAGKTKGEFYWRGTTDSHCLASGLDDYPRAKYRSPQDRHLDLLSWMAFAANTLGRLSKLLMSVDVADASVPSQGAASQSDVDEFARDYSLYTSKIEDHWHEGDGTWYDIGIDEASQDPQTGKVHFAKPSHVRHFGYVSLFPFLLQLVDPSSNKAGNEILHRTISRLMEPHLLWSRYGLRSLSRVDEFFGMKEDYWRGKIWININYLAIRALRRYASHTGASSKVRTLAKKAHDELRRNIVHNLYKVYRRTGFIWENYSAKDGSGAGCHPFTGWSALVVAIMGGK